MDQTYDMTVNIAEHINSFKEDLKNFSSSEIVQKRIIFGDCVIINADAYHNLRAKIGTKFNVHPNEVIVVGSAKLGFSIAPQKRYQFFGDTSDIDVAIVSSNLFDSFWKSVYNLWTEKVLWESETDFKKYLFQGWIRPDKLPNSKNFVEGDNWWEFFRTLTSSGEFGPYKIRGAIYKDYDFLQGYQNFAVQYCKE